MAEHSGSEFRDSPLTISFVVLALTVVNGNVKIDAVSDQTVPRASADLAEIIKVWKVRERRVRSVEIVWSQTVPSLWQPVYESEPISVTCRAIIRNDEVRFIPARVAVDSLVNAIDRVGNSNDANFSAAIANQFCNCREEGPRRILLDKYFGDGELLETYGNLEGEQVRVVRSPRST